MRYETQFVMRTYMYIQLIDIFVLTLFNVFYVFKNVLFFLFYVYKIIPLYLSLHFYHGIIFTIL